MKLLIKKKYFKKGLKFLTHIPQPQILKYKKMNENKKLIELFNNLNIDH